MATSRGDMETSARRLAVPVGVRNGDQVVDERQQRLIDVLERICVYLDRHTQTGWGWREPSGRAVPEPSGDSHQQATMASGRGCRQPCHRDPLGPGRGHGVTLT
jgi:hypothetical protein